MAGGPNPAIRPTLPNILIGIVCIVVANLLLAAVRSQVDIPLPDGLETAIAVALGVLVWFAIVSRRRV